MAEIAAKIEPNRNYFRCPICHMNTKGKLPLHLNRKHKDIPYGEAKKINLEARRLQSKMVAKRALKIVPLAKCMEKLGKKNIENNTIKFCDVKILLQDLGLEVGAENPAQQNVVSEQDSITQNFAEERLLAEIDDISSDEEVVLPSKRSKKMQQPIYSSDSEQEQTSRSTEERILPSSSKSEISWASGVKAALLKCGLYKAFPDNDPVLIEFNNYMEKDENNFSSRSRHNLVRHMAKLFMFLSCKANSEVLNIELLKDKDGIREFFHKHKECGMTGEGLKNIWDALRRFIAYVKIGTPLQIENQELYFYFVHLEDCVEKWKRGNSRVITQEVAMKRFKNVVDGDGAQTITYTLGFFMDPRLREPMNNHLEELKKQYNKVSFVQLSRYLVAYSALTNAQRVGIPENMTINEFEKGKFNDDGTLFIVRVLKHKTCTTNVGNLPIDLEMKVFFDEYLKSRKSMPFANLCTNFFVNTKGNPLNVSNEISRFEDGARLPKTTATQSRKAIQTAMVDKDQSQREMVSGVMAHSESTASKHYRTLTTQHVSDRINVLRDLQKTKDQASMPSCSSDDTNRSCPVAVSPPRIESLNSAVATQDDAELYLKLKECINEIVPPTPRAKFPSSDKFSSIVKNKLNWSIPEKRVKNIRDLWYQRQDTNRAYDTAQKLRFYKTEPDWSLVEKNLIANGWNKKEMLQKIKSHWLDAKVPFRMTIEEKEKELDAKIQTGMPDNVRVRRTKKRGDGVYATRAIEKGEYLCEYGGNLVETASVKEKFKSIEGKCYFFDIKHEGKQLTFDATEGGALGRFINHKRKMYNAVAKKRVIQNNLHLIFFADRNIEEGQEVTIDYNARNGAEDEVPYWMVVDNETDDEFMSDSEATTITSSDV